MLSGSGKTTLVRLLFKRGKGMARKASAEDGAATDTRTAASVQSERVTRLEEDLTHWPRLSVSVEG